MISKLLKKVFIFVCILALVISYNFLPPNKAKALSWSQVNTNGFGDAANTTAIRMYDFKGNIYAVVGNYTPFVGGVGIFRYDGGTTWTKVNTTGFGNFLNTEAVMTVFNDALYVGTISMSGFEVWKSPDGTTWTQVSTAGFGNPNNLGIDGMVTFNGKLYIGAENNIEGTKVYRIDTDDSWAQVNTNGFDGANNNKRTWAMDVFNGILYAGTENTNGGEIWSTPDGTTWTKVSTGGFGDAHNLRITTLFHLGSYIYGGTLNPTFGGGTGTEIWRTSNGTDWVQVNTDGFGDADNTWAGDQVAVINNTIYLGTRNDVTGGQLFTSTNGTTWTQEGSSGFGNPDNFAIYATTFNGNIYIGFSNDQTGAEIWASGALATLSLSPDSLTSGTVGLAYNVSLQAESGTAPYGYTLSGDLPPGLSLSSDGVISGTPTVAGTYTFTITLSDAGLPQQISSRTYTLIIGSGLPESGAEL